LTKKVKEIKFPELLNKKNNMFLKIFLKTTKCRINFLEENSKVLSQYYQFVILSLACEEITFENLDKIFLK